MKRTVLFTLLCLTLAPGMVWATIQGTTNPQAFGEDSINWCQFGCIGTAFPSPQPWVSTDGATGTISLINNGGVQGFYSFRQGTTLGKTWVGNFPSGMGVIYNGFVFQNQPAGIRITFDSPVEGVGAFIQGTEQDDPKMGLFSATITLFDQNGASLGSFSADGVSNQQQGTARFIGAYDVGPIFGVQFDAIDAAGNEDFAIGTLRSGPFITVPEPSSLLLFASSALGVAGVIRRRSRGVL